MCLTKITEHHYPPLGTERNAWKLYRVSAGRIRSIYDFKVPRRGIWAKAENELALYPRYFRGFHVFPTRKDAHKFLRTMISGEGVVFLRVRVKDIRTIGFQRGVPVWVADRMYLPKERP
jgi:hypothetical protein